MDTLIWTFVLTLCLGITLAGVLAWAVMSVQKDRTRSAVEWGRKLLDAQEEERRGIARELHDGIVPALDSLGMEMRRLGAEPVSDRATALAQQLRTLSRGLHPGVLDHLPLEDALAQLCSAEWGEGFIVTLDADDLPDLDFSHRLAAYRIVQEAISNARRHAAATRVEVMVDEHHGALDLAIRDNGRGFVVIPDAKLTSLGLRSMRERASALGGTVTLTSTPGEGTTVRAQLPMAAVT